MTSTFREATREQDNAAEQLAEEFASVEVNLNEDGTATLICRDEDGKAQRMTLIDEDGEPVEPPSGFLLGFVPDGPLVGWPVVAVGNGATIHTLSGVCWGTETGTCTADEAWAAVGAYLRLRDRLGLGVAS